jgi:hypothetical protein
VSRALAVSSHPADLVEIVALRAFHALAIGLHETYVLLSLRALRAVNDGGFLLFLEIVQSVDMVPVRVVVYRGISLAFSERT